MAKFIIGIDAYSDPESSQEREFITHTGYPKFVAEIIFIETQNKMGFTVDTLKLLWSEPCDKNDFGLAMSEAKKAIEYYTEKSMSIEI